MSKKVYQDAESRECYEQRNNCIICSEPKLKMVYGLCQHKLCVDCLYIDKQIRPNMLRCPLCGRMNSFPTILPIIPEDNIEHQRSLGIRECPNKNRGCKATMWTWELDNHLRTCASVQIAVPKIKKLKQPAEPVLRSLRTRHNISHSTPVRRSPRLTKK
ncbi:hypothetical protein Btru_018755 [Bulinus truncatus]|nr:hypothetical protein Btru_018755 [Bulinus truncatus]